jgi:hypothetical protein
VLAGLITRTRVAEAMQYHYGVDRRGCRSAHQFTDQGGLGQQANTAPENGLRGNITRMF